MINDILIGIAWVGALLAAGVGGYCTEKYLQLTKKQGSAAASGNGSTQEES